MLQSLALRPAKQYTTPVKRTVASTAQRAGKRLCLRKPSCQPGPSASQPLWPQWPLACSRSHAPPESHQPQVRPPAAPPRRPHLRCKAACCGLIRRVSHGQKAQAAHAGVQHAGAPAAHPSAKPFTPLCTAPATGAAISPAVPALPRPASATRRARSRGSGTGPCAQRACTPASKPLAMLFAPDASPALASLGRRRLKTSLNATAPASSSRDPSSDLCIMLSLCAPPGLPRSPPAAHWQARRSRAVAPLEGRTTAKATQERAPVAGRDLYLLATLPSVRGPHRQPEAC